MAVADAGRRPAAAPGLLVVAGLTGLAFAVSAAVPGLGPTTVAVVLGALLTGSGLHRGVLRPGTRLASRRLLRLAVVLLGLRLSVPDLLDLGLPGIAVVVVTVAVTFAGTRLLGRALGVSGPRRLLVATGFSICGASAIAAVQPVAGGDEEDAAVAVALVTLCGSLAILLLPLLRAPLGLSVPDFGAWAGASVHDVGQTVATAARVPGALTTAVVVKLARVLLLAPLVAGLGLARQRAQRARGGAQAVVRPPVLPAFVAGFAVAVALRSTGLLPASVLRGAQHVQDVLLPAALVGLGTGISLPALRRTGGRVLVLGLASWLLVAVVAYLGVRLTRG